MQTFIIIIQNILAVVGVLAAVVSIPLFIAFRWPQAGMWGLKIYVSALSPLIALVGIITAITGIVTGAAFISILGFLVALVYAVHIFSVTRPPAYSSGFKQAFGLNWQRNIAPAQKTYFMPTRTALFLPAVPQARLEQNIAFATIPGTDRNLFCDVWQPPEGVSPSGVAFIYLHGGAFYILDKDYGTRPFFKHLAAQGHVVMDVAYRMAPETDVMGMVHDAKRSIAWLKEHAVSYGIHPDKIVLGGGSAGGHIALLAAYTYNNTAFTPDALRGNDLRVSAVISLYGTSSMEALYYHTKQHLTKHVTTTKPKKARTGKIAGWVMKSLSKDYHRLGLDKGLENIGYLAPLLGGSPDDCPERYALFSAITHVHQGCPITLLIHGEHDIMAPVSATYELYDRLIAQKVPVILHIIPQTDHGFDLVLPKISPAAHNAIYDVERFMALIGSGKALADSKAIWEVELKAV